LIPAEILPYVASVRLPQAAYGEETLIDRFPAKSGDDKSLVLIGKGYELISKVMI
jgi:hypothetical protein